MAKCPKCERVLTRVKIKEVEVSAGPSSVSWNGLAYHCPYCFSILSVGIDPVALKTDTVNAILKALKR